MMSGKGYANVSSTLAGPRQHDGKRRLQWTNLGILHDALERKRIGRDGYWQDNAKKALSVRSYTSTAGMYNSPRSSRRQKNILLVGPTEPENTTVRALARVVDAPYVKATLLLFCDGFCY